MVGTMTTESHAEYGTPPENKFENFLQLSDENLRIIANANQQIMELDKPADAMQLVQQLNDVFLQEGMMGVSVRVESQFATVLGQEFDGLLTDSTYNGIVKDQYDGIFLGCNAITVGDYTELMYGVQLAMDDESLFARTVTAPVRDSSLLMSFSPSNMPSGHEQEFIAALDALEDLGDKNVDSLIDQVEALVQSNKHRVTHALIQETGLLAFDLLNIPAVAQSQKAQADVTRLLEPLFDPGALYEIRGVSIEPDESSPEEVAAMQFINTTVRIEGIYSTQDFERRTVDGAWVNSGLCQLALAVTDEENAYIMPFHSIHYFEIKEYSNAKGNCRASGARFQDEFPEAIHPVGGQTVRLKKYIKHLMPDHLRYE